MNKLTPYIAALIILGVVSFGITSGCDQTPPITGSGSSVGSANLNSIFNNPDNADIYETDTCPITCGTVIFL